MTLINRVREKINQYDFLKNIIVLLSGSSIALLIPFIVTPILTRLFTPEDFGLWGTYSAVVAVCSVLANGRYELAILLPKTDGEAFNIFSGSLIISILVALVSFIIILFWGTGISESLNMPRLKNWLYFVPFALILIAIRQASNYWLNRHKRFKTLSYGKVVQSGTTACSNLSIGKFFYFSGGLIISTLIGQFALAIYYISQIKLKENIKRVSLDGIRKTLYSHRDFPLKSGPGILLNILKEQAPIFLFAYFFDATIVGFYSLIIRLFGVPLTLVAGSIGQVYFQKAVELNKKNENVYPLFWKTSSRLFLLLTLPVIAIMIWGEGIFSIVFGNEWLEAGKILVIFTIYYAIRFIVSAQSTLLIVFRKLTLEVIFNFTALVLQVASLIIGGLRNDYYLSFYLMSISGAVMYTLLGVYFWIYLKTKK